MIVSNIVIYEQPINERVRNFMRLEYLFAAAEGLIAGSSLWDSRNFIQRLIDILDILSRLDFKPEILAGLKYFEKALLALQDKPEVNVSYLNSLVQRLEHAQSVLHGITGQLGKNLRDHDLLNAVRQRSSTAGGTSPLDLPILHHWLQLPAETRHQQQLEWLSELDAVKKPITLMLQLIRESTLPSVEMGRVGSYQQALEPTIPYQMIRVGLPASSGYFAEISASKFSVNIRFLQPEQDERPRQVSNDVTFELSCCAI